MRTKLPEAITTKEQAAEFLTDLFNNHESYHPEDDATNINWFLVADEQKPTHEECVQLNKLMDDIWELRSEFDACGHLLNLMQPFITQNLINQ
jgi:hypothetical protein